MMNLEQGAQHTGPYRVMKSAQLSGGGISTRAVDPDDIESIRVWRNAQMAVLRQPKPISAQEQVDYFANQVWPEKTKNKPRQILVAIEQAKTLIGYGGLVYIDWNASRAEVSFLVDNVIEANPERRRDIFFSFLKLMQQLAFGELGLNRLFTETFANREKHIQTLEAAGFKLEGTLREHVVVDGNKTDSLMHGILSKDG